MGYLFDNIPPTQFGVECESLYTYRIIIDPFLSSDKTLQELVEDVVPDVETWQFSGRRKRCPRTDGKQVRIIHPYGFSNQDRKTQQYLERVVFAFSTEVLRDQVAARLTNEGFQYTVQNGPGTTPPEEYDPIIILP